MATADVHQLSSTRYGEDLDLLEAIRSDPLLVEHQTRIEVFKGQGQVRLKLLATSVRVTNGMLPELSASTERIRRRVDIGKPLETFVFSEAGVNAFVSETRERFLVGISSGALSILTAEELEFVIGHELGHALYRHTEFAASFLAEEDRVSQERSQLLLSWQRATEISADRVGLQCCPSLETASSALVKTLAGVPLNAGQLNPSDISGQLDSLLEEVMDIGQSDVWRCTHPFPPMRIRALEAFASHQASDTVASADQEIRRMLSLMSATNTSAAAPQGAEEGLLARFLLWGGLFVGTANGSLSPVLEVQLRALTVPGLDFSEALAAAQRAGTSVPLERFKAAKAARRGKLRALEISSLMKQLIGFASVDGRVGEEAEGRLAIVAAELGLQPRALQLLLQQHAERKSSP